MEEGDCHLEGSIVPKPAAAPQAVFMDAASMKEQIRAAATKPEYDVANFYHKEGLFQYIARHPIFEHTTLGVIAFNALWISIDTDLNHAMTLLQADPVFQIMEHAFCFYFTFEWYVRFMAFERKRNGLRDSWFVFDSGMVLMMVGETWVMTGFMLFTGGGSSGGMGNASILRMARLLRLSRMARMARLFRAMPELLILIKGMVSATRSVLFTLCLLGIIIYVFGIAFVQLLDGTDAGQKHFSSVPVAMHTLLLDGALMDNLNTVVYDLGAVHPIYTCLFYIFVLLASLTVMNMLIGVLCEVVSAVASTEKESLQVAFVKGKLMEIMNESGLDQDGDMEISKEEFSKILQIPQATRLLQEVGVDPFSLVDNIDFIFAPTTDPSDEEEEEEEEMTLSFGSFMDLILQMRGTNTATVKDIVELRKCINDSHNRLREEFRDFTRGNSRSGLLKRKPSSLNAASFMQADASPSPTEAASEVALPTGNSNGCFGHQAPQQDLSLRRHKLVEALVVAQAELQRFADALPAGAQAPQELQAPAEGQPARSVSSYSSYSYAQQEKVGKAACDKLGAEAPEEHLLDPRRKVTCMEPWMLSRSTSSPNCWSAVTRSAAGRTNDGLQEVHGQLNKLQEAMARSLRDLQRLKEHPALLTVPAAAPFRRPAAFQEPA